MASPKKRKLMVAIETMELVNELKTIQGESLNEIFINYNRYLSKHDISLAKNLDEVLLNYKPENDLQNVFKLGLINKFKREPEALEILKSGDIANIHVVLKWTWFFKDVDASDFLSNTISHFSYMTRIKVIKKYSKYLKNTDKAEEIFEGLRTQYGLNLAYHILPACGEKFLRRNIHSFCLQIPYSTLKTIYKKYPEPVVDYLEYILKGKQSGARSLKKYDIQLYEGIFKTLVIKDSKRFIDLYDKYTFVPSFKLGRRSTKYIVAHHKQSIIKNYSSYSKLIKNKHLILCLTIDEIKQLQLNLYPKSISKFFDPFSDQLSSLLRLTTRIKKHNCEQMLIDNFEQVYKKKLTPEEIPVKGNKVKNLLPFLPIEIRKQWISQADAEEKCQFVMYLPTESSIPLLKAMIEKESEMYRRVEIVGLIMGSIEFNKDASALPLALEYFNTRFRNDQESLRDTIVNELAKMGNILHHLDFDSWKPIDYLFDIIKLNKEHTRKYSQFRQIYSVRIKKCFELGLDPDNYLNHFFENFCKCDQFYDYDLLQNTIYQKKCLEWFIKHFQHGNVKEDPFECQTTKMFCTICNYNSKHKDKVIIPDLFIENIIEILNHENGGYQVKRFILKNLVNLELKKKVIPNLTLKELPHFSKLLKYFLKNDPSFLLNNIDIIIKIIFDTLRDNFNNFFKSVKLYSNFGIPQKVIEICIKYLEKEDDSLYPSKAVKVLSNLLSSDEFLNIASKYCPINEKVDDFSDHTRAVYDIQKSIAGSFKNVNNPGKTLNILKKFAVGDFLKLVVGSINSVCKQVPQKDILPVLIKWFDSPVSAKKHFIRCFNYIAPIQDKIQVLHQLFENEKNSSLRLVIYKQVFTNFINEPVEITFNGFSLILYSLKLDDNEILMKMYDISLIPNEYVSTYIEVLWNLVNNNKSLGRKEKTNVINLITKDIINLLANEFCDRLVDQVFLLADEDLILRYLLTYILYSNDKNVQDVRLQNVLTSMHDFIKNRYNVFNITAPIVFQARGLIYKFVSSICDEIKQLDSGNRDTTDLLKYIKTRLDSDLKEENGYGLPLEETIMLEYTIMIKEKRAKETNHQNIVEFVTNMFEKYAKDYSFVILNLACNIIGYNCMETKELLNLIDMLLDNTNIWCNLLAVDILPGKLDDDTLVEEYRNILQKLVKKDNPILRESINANLRNLKSRITVS